MLGRAPDMRLILTAQLRYATTEHVDFTQCAVCTLNQCAKIADAERLNGRASEQG